MTRSAASPVVTSPTSIAWVRNEHTLSEHCLTRALRLHNIRTRIFTETEHSISFFKRESIFGSDCVRYRPILSCFQLLGLVLLIAVFRLCHPGEYTGVCTAPVRSSAPRPRHQTHHVLAARPAREAPAAAEPYHHQPVYCERSSDGWFS